MPPLSLIGVGLLRSCFKIAYSVQWLRCDSVQNTHVLRGRSEQRLLNRIEALPWNASYNFKTASNYVTKD